MRRPRFFVRPISWLLFILCALVLGLSCSTGDSSTNPDDNDNPGSSEPLSLETFLFPVMAYGQQFEQVIKPTNGKPPYTYTVTGMPSGITYQAAPDSLTIYGTILQHGGNYNIQVQVGDQNESQVTGSFKLVIGDPVIQLAGTWDLTLANFNATEDCEGVRPADWTETREVTLTQEGNDITVIGWVDDDLPGEITFDSYFLRNSFGLSALYPAFGDTMETVFNTRIYSEGGIYADYLTGSGYWEWQGSGASGCYGGLEVTARRVFR